MPEQVQTPAAEPVAPVTVTAEPVVNEPVLQVAPVQTETVEDLRAQLARVEKALKEANKEDAARRKKLSDFEKAEQERQQAAMSEMDKLKAQLAERDKAVSEAQAAHERAMAETAQMRVRSAIVAQAAMLGFQNPDDAYSLVDLATVTVADGDVKGITESLAALAKAKPYLLKGKAAPPQVAPTNPGTNASNGMTDDQLREMVFGSPNRSFFTAETAKRHGGGVVFVNKP